MITNSALITRALRKARDGASSADTKLFEDNAELLIPNAAHRLAQRVAMDAARRDLLMKSYSLAIAAGLVDLSVSPDILTEGLPYSLFYAADDPDQLNPYIFKRHARMLDGYLNPNFGYYAEKNSFLVTRYRSDGNIQSSKLATPGPITLIVNHIPTTSAAEFPEQLDDDVVETLVELLLELRMTPPKK
jgi:hypothetical protein